VSEKKSPRQRYVHLYLHAHFHFHFHFHFHNHPRAHAVACRRCSLLTERYQARYALMLRLRASAMDEEGEASLASRVGMVVMAGSEGRVKLEAVTRSRRRMRSGEGAGGVR
jgi:hypothetical protein